MPGIGPTVGAYDQRQNESINRLIDDYRASSQKNIDDIIGLNKPSSLADTKFLSRESPKLNDVNNLSKLGEVSRIEQISSPD